MYFANDDGPIIACCTGDGSSAVSVLRISGFEKLETFNESFSINLSSVIARKVYYTDLIENDEVIDDILLTYFESPASYNGENIIELSTHGNPLIVSRIIDLFKVKYYLRKAEPGEFTYRALKNNKLSLNQVEGLDLLLNSKSYESIKSGRNYLNQSINEYYTDLNKKFINLKSALEMNIDFLEDIGEEQANDNLISTCLNLVELVNELYGRCQGDIGSLLDPEIVLFGETNAGKSTFFNKLVNYNRSIVSDIAGTTRDYVSETLRVGGNSFRLVDTAGLRELTCDLIEEEGIVRAKKMASGAFFKVLLINPTAGKLTPELFNSLSPIDLIVFTHSLDSGFAEGKKKIMDVLPPYLYTVDVDQMGGYESLVICRGSIEPPYSTGSIEPPPLFKPGPIGPGKQHRAGPMGPKKIGKSGSIGPILSLFTSKFKHLHESQPILITRHRETIETIKIKMDDFTQEINASQDVAILSGLLNSIGHDIAELIGIITPDDVLDNIFENFCIGK